MPYRFLNITFWPGDIKRGANANNIKARGDSDVWIPIIELVLALFIIQFREDSVVTRPVDYSSLEQKGYFVQLFSCYLILDDLTSYHIKLRNKSLESQKSAIT